MPLGLLLRSKDPCTANVVKRQVYSTFDVDGHGKVDWRCMVFMLRVAVNAQVTWYAPGPTFHRVASVTILNQPGGRSTTDDILGVGQRCEHGAPPGKVCYCS